MNQTTKDIISLSVMAALIVTVIILIIKRIRAMNNTTENPINPVKGKITSKFGKRTAPTEGASTTHNGVDIAVPVGTRIVAPWDGTVLDTYANTAGGNQMIVTHPNGYRTGYAHLSGYIKRIGQSVKAGEEICLSGNTGHTTGPHLHFTLTDPHGGKIDPESMFDFKS